MNVSDEHLYVIFNEIFSSFDDETFQMLFEPRSTYIQNQNE